MFVDHPCSLAASCLFLQTHLALPSVQTSSVTASWLINQGAYYSRSPFLVLRLENVAEPHTSFRYSGYLNFDYSGTAGNLQKTPVRSSSVPGYEAHRWGLYSP